MPPQELFAADCKTLLDVLLWRAEATPERGAYVFLNGRGEEQERLSYAQLALSARALAGRIGAEFPLARGDRVLLLTGPGLSFLVGFFAAQLAGLVPVPCVTPRPGRSIAKLLSIDANCAPRLVLTDPSAARNVTAVLASEPQLQRLPLCCFDYADGAAAPPLAAQRPGADDIAFLQYTSGSTADPKGVVLSHANLMANERMIAVAMHNDARSTWVGWAPLHHDQGLIGNALQPLYTGALSVLMAPVAFAQRPLLWLQAISKYRARVSGGPNFAYDLCAQRATQEELSRLSLDGWEVAFNGADTIRRETLERFERAFAPCGFRGQALFSCYGLAEASVFVSGGPLQGGARYERPPARPGGDESPQAAPRERWLVACGAPADGETVLIVDPERALPLAAGEIGEIWVAGPNVAARYWNNAQASASLCARLAPEAAAQHASARFLRTGDLGFLTREGQLVVSGRIKDLIIVEGRNHYPQDIELLAQTASALCVAGGGAAVAYSDARGLRVALVQELSRPQPPELLQKLTQDVRRAVAQELDLTLHDLVFVPKGTLPRTSSGKLQRGLTRQLLVTGELEAAAARARLPESPRQPPPFAREV